MYNITILRLCDRLNIINLKWNEVYGVLLDEPTQK